VRGTSLALSGRQGRNGAPLHHREITMNKNALSTLCGLTLLSLALYAPSVFGDEIQQQKKTTTTETTTTSTNSSGTVSTFGPDQIVIRTSPSASPLTYQFEETTTFVDEAGNPVERTTVTTGAPVTVYYSKSGDKMVATKVVVKKTTTTMPRG
jgi:hypothetical protein